MTFAARRAIAGRLFLLPWIIGFVYFFLVPFIQGIVYTLNKLSFTANGVVLDFVGFANYKKLISDLDFLKVLANALAEMFPRVIIIVFFSLFVALILRGEYRGRTLARAVFFLPVIISSGVVITVLQENVMGTNLSGKESAYLFQAASFETLLSGIGLSDQMLAAFTDIINRLFDLSWKSGVQILLLLAAVNNIPRSHYEAAVIEGATEWEKFWKITFPMMAPTLLVAIIYTIIDGFTDYGNKVMQMLNSFYSKGDYEYSATIGVIYFVCVLLVIGLVELIASRTISYSTD